MTKKYYGFQLYDDGSCAELGVEIDPARFISRLTDALYNTLGHLETIEIGTVNGVGPEEAMDAIRKEEWVRVARVRRKTREREKRAGYLMTVEKLVSLFELYDQPFLSKGYPAREMTEHDYAARYPATSMIRAHVRWMCQRGVEMAKSGEPGSVEKAMRWLGFIQGALLYEGCYSVKEMREHSREEKK